MSIKDLIESGFFKENEHIDALGDKLCCPIGGIMYLCDPVTIEFYEYKIPYGFEPDDYVY